MCVVNLCCSPINVFVLWLNALRFFRNTTSFRSISIQSVSCCHCQRKSPGSETWYDSIFIFEFVSTICTISKESPHFFYPIVSKKIYHALSNFFATSLSLILIIPTPKLLQPHPKKCHLTPLKLFYHPNPPNFSTPPKQFCPYTLNNFCHPTFKINFVTSPTAVSEFSIQSHFTCKKISNKHNS